MKNSDVKKIKANHVPIVYCISMRLQFVRFRKTAQTIR